VRFLKSKVEQNERQIKLNKDKLRENFENQKTLEDGLTRHVHDGAPLKALDGFRVNEEKKESAKKEEKKDEEAKEEAKDADEAKVEEKKAGKWSSTVSDLIVLLAKVGWWTGVWKQQVSGHVVSVPMFEGDMITLNDDGTFTSKGSLNLEDGNVWLNLVDGSLNLKRTQEPGKPEALSNDYYMTYDHRDTA